MQKVYNKGFSGWGQLGILIGFSGLGLIIGGMVSIPIWKIMTHGSLMNMEKDLLKPENVDAVKVIQVISTVFMFLFPTVAYAFICYRNGWGFLGFREKWNVKHLGIVLLLIACSFPLMSALEQINKMIPISASLKAKFDAMEKTYNEQVLLMVQLNSFKQYLSSLLLIAVLPAITEEIAFRGGLQNLLTRWLRSPWAAILISSLLFSAIHLSWYGFFVRFFLGAILGTIFYYTKNIWMNILMHFVNNAIVVTSLYMTTRSGKPIDLSSEDKIPLWIGGISLVLVLALIRQLIKISPQPEPPAFFEKDENYIDPENPF